MSDRVSSGGHSGTSAHLVSAVEVLTDAFTRVRGSVHGVLRGVRPQDLSARLDPGANTIAWLVWHSARVQDDHLSELVGSEQLWSRDGWFDRFGLPFEASATGYGQTAAQVAALDGVGADLLGGYFDAVHARTLDIVGQYGADDLARVVDDSYDPPVTLAARLVSVVNDCTQHVGQAALIKGVSRRLSA